MEQPNLSYIHALSGGDKAFEEKLVSIIKTEFPEEKSIYFKHIKSANFKESAEIVHKLKHKISILGLEKSYEVAASFEDNLKENSSVGKEDFENILNAITTFLATL
ncbi:Hpt domain-containing protein [Thalassobellus sediminis]|uniref:Hpt domain-containing protein n=1 Tax=Thalassobellus sediminis TaxID=3367753 RepID=UPI0037881791